VPLAAVEFHELVEVVWVSLVAGIGITTVFSVVVYGVARAGESQREGRSAAATGFYALAAVALLVFLGIVATGVGIMLQK
jgi:hypothetical protein